MTPDVIARREALVSEYRVRKGLSAVAFSLRLGMSDTAIRGIIREDRTRFASAKQVKLLKELGVTRGEWYGA